MKRFRVLIVAAAIILASGLLTAKLWAVTWSSTVLPINNAPIAIVQASATGAAAQVVATLPAASGKFTYIEGFTVTGTGSTAALAVNVAVAGPTNTMNYAYLFVAGVTTANGTLDIRFPTPIPSSALNTAITVTVPTGGSGNTQSSVCAYGFQQ